MQSGALWPEPLIQLNPAFEQVETIEELVAKKSLHEECSRIFRVGRTRIALRGARTINTSSNGPT
jgi:hypothetical protein